MVRYDGLINPFHSRNLSRLTHPTILLFVKGILNPAVVARQA